MSLLFVYGTLKKGCCNHHLLENSVPVSEAFTEDRFRMLNLEYFPGVVKGKPVSRISGEVYDVVNETLDVLDEFEGKWFYREDVLLGNGSKAAMYFLSAEVPCERYPVIGSGNWMDHPVSEDKY
ncbi:gamma-glutamylcyclotransferase family protein [Methanococcoides sp. LMO-2]|uniref:Gamma-glutamylcyclotransferase family protein n=1 Tax=Methanococcoides cohabitans TaxID=3136559 RepID=A0ABU9KU75_9EURY